MANATIFTIVENIKRVEMSKIIKGSVKWLTGSECCASNGWGLNVLSFDSLWSLSREEVRPDVVHQLSPCGEGAL